MKVILMSIKPEWLAKILNGEKTAELRKRFPLDYVGWVYLYCTKGHYSLHKGSQNWWFIGQYKKLNCGECFNGKVVARFWCDEVKRWNGYFEDLCSMVGGSLPINFISGEQFIKKCHHEAKVDLDTLNKYLGDDNKCCLLPINQLEIFDKPKELGEFHYYKKRLIDCGMYCPPYFDEVKTQVHKAPQSWQYIYIEEDK